jgi:hypothetical protein
MGSDLLHSVLVAYKKATLLTDHEEESHAELAGSTCGPA